MAKGNDLLLEVNNLTKYFGGHKAIDSLSLRISKGELRCIIGPNGSGKTTFFNLVTGKYKPDHGSIFFKGNDITGLDIAEICRNGIGRKFQVPNIFDQLSVMDNLSLAVTGKNPFGSLLMNNSKKGQRQELERLLGIIKLFDRRNEKASALSHGEKQWLEIGMVLANRPDLMLLDEPTAGMTTQETQQTVDLVRSLFKEATIVVIEHDVDFVREIGGRVTVFHRGAILADGTFSEIAANTTVRDVYLGEET
jgi:urea transport system ATP-binding protein